MDIAQIEAELSTKRTELGIIKNGRYAHMLRDQALQLESEITHLERELSKARGAIQHAEFMAGIRAQMAENRKQLEAEKQAAAEAAAAAQMEAEQTNARDAFIANGGTEAEFIQAWPRLRSALIEKRTLEAMTQPAPPSALDRWIARKNGVGA